MWRLWEVGGEPGRRTAGRGALGHAQGGSAWGQWMVKHVVSGRSHSCRAPPLCLSYAWPPPKSCPGLPPAAAHSLQAGPAAARQPLAEHYGRIHGVRFTQKPCSGHSPDPKAGTALPRKPMGTMGGQLRVRTRVGSYTAVTAPSWVTGPLRTGGHQAGGCSRRARSLGGRSRWPVAGAAGAPALCVSRAPSAGLGEVALVGITRSRELEGPAATTTERPVELPPPLLVLSPLPSGAALPWDLGLPQLCHLPQVAAPALPSSGTQGSGGTRALG